jgi:hypothetical protein
MGTDVLLGRTTLVLVGAGVELGWSTCGVAVAIGDPDAGVVAEATWVIIACKVCAVRVPARFSCTGVEYRGI